MLKLNNLSDRQSRIFQYLNDGQWHLASEIILAVSSSGSTISVKRDLRSLFEAGLIERFGRARATKYRRSPIAQFLSPVEIEKYFLVPQDTRGTNIRFNLSIFSQMNALQLFTAAENRKLNSLLTQYRKNVQSLSASLLKREFERVTIDLSWKSSAIEGNTYTLLETESLLKEGITAPGKTREESLMILNHKSALEYVRGHSTEFQILTTRKIEEVHSLLIKDLDVFKNVRKRAVGITGTNYRPLDNEFQIRESLENACQLINKRTNVFEKAMLAILLISYIQPFEDGNKRISRLIANATLLSHDGFPLSFRNIDINRYKMAVLLFYETNNLSEFKLMFIEQAQFAAEEYFR